MSFVVVSSHESIHGKDLQQPGDSVAVFSSQALAGERYAARCASLDAAARAMRDGADDGGSIIWIVLLKLPVPAEDIDEALETLEIIVEETDDIAGELDDLVISYTGTVYAASGETDYARERAIDNLHAWLS